MEHQVAGTTQNEEKARCEGPGCKQTFAVIPGHRRRHYCGDTCRKAAQRDREDRARQKAEEMAKQARYEQEMAALRKRYGTGSLSPKCLEYLLDIRGRYGEALMQEFGQMLINEITAAHHSWAVTRSNLIREIMELAELLKYGPVSGPAGITIEGIDAYSRVVELADMEELQNLRDAAYLAVKGQQRLEMLSKRLGNCDAGQLRQAVTIEA